MIKSKVRRVKISSRRVINGPIGEKAIAHREGLSDLKRSSHQTTSHLRYSSTTEEIHHTSPNGQGSARAV
jgi:hypothetical protein